MSEKLTIGDVLRDRHAIDAVARTYPLDDATIAAYADVIDWPALSSNPHLAWSEALIERYAERWDWDMLAWNPALPWSVAFVREHVAGGRFRWSRLRWQPAMVRDPALVALCFPHWIELPASEWTAGSHDETGAGPFGPVTFNPWGEGAEAWAHPLVEELPGLPWQYFSCIEGFPWTEAFIAKHADRLDWRRLSWNPGLPWNVDFMRRFADRIDWRRGTYRIPWTAELVRAFADRLNWRALSDRLAWTPELFEELAARIYWATPDMDHGGWEGTFGGLFQHPALVWTPERFARLRPHLEAHFARLFREDEDLGGGDDDDDDDEPARYWTAYCETSNWAPELFPFAIALGEELGEQTIDWDQVSRHARTPWTDEFVARHAAELSMYGLQNNPHFPWARYLPQLADRLDTNSWRSLGASAGFAPTVELLARYGDRLDWKALSRNAHLTPEIIAAYVDRWNWSELAGNKVITPELARQIRDGIPRDVLANQLRKLAPDETAASRRALVARSPDEPLDDTIVRELLAATRGDRAMTRESGLEAAIDASPNDPGVYLPYADWLQRIGDPQGELITLMIAGTTDAAVAAEVPLAIARYRDRLDLERIRVLWRFGFADEVYGLTKDWQRHLASRPFRFVRGLSLGDSASSELVPDDLAVIAQLTWLERLALRGTELSAFAPLRALVWLRDLRLDHAPVADLGVLAALPRLELLSLWNTGISDLAPVAAARRLTTLHVGHNPVRSLAPLHGLVHLVELDIRYSHASDLAPLEALPALRYLLLEESRVSPAEVARFTRARPDVAITSYTAWPGATTMLPFWDGTYAAPLGPPAR